MKCPRCGRDGDIFRDKIFNRWYCTAHGYFFRDSKTGEWVFPDELPDKEDGSGSPIEKQACPRGPPEHLIPECLCDTETDLEKEEYYTAGRHYQTFIPGPIWQEPILKHFPSRGYF
jgi:hypothetical protein